MLDNTNTLQRKVYYDALSIVVKPLNDRFETQGDGVVIAPKYIDQLVFNLKTYGFEGKISFTLSSKNSMNEDLSFLLNNRGMFALEFILQVRDHIQLSDANTLPMQSNTIKLMAVFDPLSKNPGTLLSLSEIKFNQFQDQQQCEVYEANQVFNFTFSDPLAAIAKKIKTIKVFQDSTHKDVITSMSAAFSNLVKLEIDDALTQFTQDKQPYICVNSIEFGLYNSLIEWLYDYQLQLYFNYDKQEYFISSQVETYAGQYEVSNGTLSTPDTHKLDKVLLLNTQQALGKCNIANISYPLPKSQLSSIDRGLTDDVFSRVAPSYYQIPNQYQQYVNYVEKKEQNEDSSAYLIQLEFGNLPTQLPLYPVSGFSFPDGFFDSYANELNDSYRITAIAFEFKFHQNIKDYRAFDSHSRLTNEMVDQKMPLNIATKLTLISDKSTAIDLPAYQKTTAFKAQACVIKDDASTDDIYATSLYQGATKTASDISQQPSDDTSYHRFTPYSDDQMSYHIELPSLLLADDESSNSFAAVVKPNSLLSQAYFPLRNNTQVWVDLHREYIEISASLMHHVNSDIFASQTAQVTGINWGSQNEATIRYEVGSQDSALYIEQNNDSGKKTLQINKDGFTLKLTD
ncbi:MULTISPECIES: hypothetical protein [Cysteiniphilum]|uniref:Uncharacterized protein n=1 Tax=Cysteiniphilum litorale TaxID=2056700 RepID=A0A8J2Z6W9_9GAMM|nr:MULTISPECIES: hypothetical protein [Cysteiniphilum]GGG07081.1 hypothetical protein GCM10010995_25720 [Cysteiniphilum litorale]